MVFNEKRGYVFVESLGVLNLFVSGENKDDSISMKLKDGFLYFVSRNEEQKVNKLPENEIELLARNNFTLNLFFTEDDMDTISHSKEGVLVRQE